MVIRQIMVEKIGVLISCEDLMVTGLQDIQKSTDTRMSSKLRAGTAGSAPNEFHLNRIVDQAVQLNETILDPSVYWSPVLEEINQ